MEFVLVGIDIILQEDLNIIIHLLVDVLAQEAANDCYTLLYHRLAHRLPISNFLRLRTKRKER